MCVCTRAMGCCIANLHLTEALSVVSIDSKEDEANPIFAGPSAFFAYVGALD